MGLAEFSRNKAAPKLSRPTFYNSEVESLSKEGNVASKRVAFSNLLKTLGMGNVLVDAIVHVIGFCQKLENKTTNYTAAL